MKLVIGLYLIISVAALMVSGDDAFEQSAGELVDISRPMRSSSRHAMEGPIEEDSHERDQPEQKDSFQQAGEYAKLMLNPLALIKKISHDFNLPKNKLIQKVGKGLVFGAEALLSPVISCIKIIEKVFVPDACRLKFVCQFGSRLDFMRETMLKFSPHFIETSAHVKALSHGIIGRDCVQTYADCEPTLQGPFKDLKETQQSGQYDGQQSN